MALTKERLDSIIRYIDGEIIPQGDELVRNIHFMYRGKDSIKTLMVRHDTTIDMFKIEGETMWLEDLPAFGIQDVRGITDILIQITSIHILESRYRSAVKFSALFREDGTIVNNIGENSVNQVFSFMAESTYETKEPQYDIQPDSRPHPGTSED